MNKEKENLNRLSDVKRMKEVSGGGDDDAILLSDILCEYCEGSGHVIEDGETVECPKCKGTGDHQK